MTYTTTSISRNWFIFREKGTGNRMAVEQENILCFKDSTNAMHGEILIRHGGWVAVHETFERFVELLRGEGGAK